LARPYICRFNSLMRVTWPSTGRELHGRVKPAVTASQSWRTPCANAQLRDVAGLGLLGPGGQLPSTPLAKQPSNLLGEGDGGGQGRAARRHLIQADAVAVGRRKISRRDGPHRQRCGAMGLVGPRTWAQEVEVAAHAAAAAAVALLTDLNPWAGGVGASLGEAVGARWPSIQDYSTSPAPDNRMAQMAFEAHPVTKERWPDLVELFDRPIVRTCFCMFYRKTGTGTGVGLENQRAMKALVDRGTVPGLIGYENGVPVAWVSLGPREDYAKLRRSPVMKPVDDRPVWSIVCFFVDRRARGRGLSERMLRAAVDYARSCGARLVEAYPVDKDERSHPDFMFFGAKSMYDRAGFREVARRRATRPVVRKALRPGSSAGGP
jgi:GNAT superfamily N-acetyltransferase